MTPPLRLISQEHEPTVPEPAPRADRPAQEVAVWPLVRWVLVVAGLFIGALALAHVAPAAAGVLLALALGLTVAGAPTTERSR